MSQNNNNSSLTSILVSVLLTLAVIALVVALFQTKVHDEHKKDLFEQNYPQFRSE